MRTTTPTAPARRWRRHRPAPPVSGTTTPVPGRATPEPRERRAGRPEDRALYTCGCGRAFTAAVTASVACPGCGGAQSW